ncbi:MAG: preprotein translocase subunit SecY [Chloroflexi bacterium]|nr:preprotein translocase subunit SecY [Chloroflexota bacterium]
MIQAMVDALHLPDLRQRLLFTFAMLVVFRFVAHIPVPGVDLAELQRLFQGNQLLGMLDLFSGGAMRNLSIAAMGVYPYITATIIMQLLVPVIPRLQAMAQEGEIGRQRINTYTHWATVPLAALQGYSQLILLQRAGVVAGVGFTGANLTPTVAMVLSMVAGTVFLVWLGELITERGIGNGVSIIIFGGIVATLPQMAGQAFFATINPGGLMVFGVLGLATVAIIVIFTVAERRVPVQYARSQFRGGRMYRAAGSTYLPLRVNTAGMIPLIFALSIMIFPGTVASWFVTSDVSFIANASRVVRDLFDLSSWFYWTLYFSLTVGFAFFYTMVIFQQQNLADTLQKSGGFVPGIRPGRPTADYLNRVINRITWGGALFLGGIAVLPFFAEKLTNIQALTLSSTALLIVVGVVLDTMRQLEAQLMLRQYEGFMR